MGYYMRGDYYRGDYYRGDWGSFVRGALGVVGKVAGAISNPVATISGALTGHPVAPQAPGAVIPRGGQAFAQPPAGGGGGGAGGAPAGMRGYHLNKARLYPSKRHPQGAAPHTVPVRNRHMHATNPRALARASTRAHAFLRMTRRFVRYYHAKPPKGRPYIGRKRGRSR